jgi:hypothetical protein
MKSIVIYPRPPRHSSVRERRWSMEDVAMHARLAGADVFRSGSGLRLEFDDDSDADSFSERASRGGFRVADQD